MRRLVLRNCRALDGRIGRRIRPDGAAGIGPARDARGAIAAFRPDRAAGRVQTVQNPLPGGLQSVNTITSTVQVQGAYQGSVPSAAAAGPALSLSLDEAVRRGLEYNLGAVSNRNSVRQTRGYQRVERSALLPHLSADLLARGAAAQPGGPGIRGATFPESPRWSVRFTTSTFAPA